MKLSNRLPAALPLARRPGPPAPESGPTTWDTVKRSAHFVAGGAAFKTAKFIGEMWQGRQGLQDSPKVQIARPVVFVPGFTTPVDPYLPLVAHLTDDGLNGGRTYFVRNGVIFNDHQCTQVVDSQRAPDARVFVVMPFTRYDTPPRFAEQLKPDLEAVSRFTGSPVSDAVGYSMGGISTRLFLDQGGAGVGKFLMVGTPNQGSKVGSLAHWAVKNDIGWAMALANHAPAALNALEWLRGVQEDNPSLKELNSHWGHQRALVEEARVIGAEGLPTPGFSPWGWSSGDTAVEKAALGLPGLEVFTVSGGLTKSHETLMADPDVFREMSCFLGWNPI
ncbi:hypothetical protein IV102_13505 [bacterium]|nr:hypothetical protein [bacterium]